MVNNTLPASIIVICGEIQIESFSELSKGLPLKVRAKDFGKSRASYFFT